MSLFRFSKGFQSLLMKGPCLPNLNKVAIRCSSLWEPDYLTYAKTLPPDYDQVNVQIKSFDYTILENYQKVIHRIAKLMDIDVGGGWPIPCQHLHITKLKPNSEVVETEYKLKIYERNVQIVDVKARLLPLFIEAVITACPPSVKLSIHEHDADFEEMKYVPDFEVLDLKQQLEEIGSTKKKKKKKNFGKS